MNLAHGTALALTQDDDYHCTHTNILTRFPKRNLDTTSRTAASTTVMRCAALIGMGPKLEQLLCDARPRMAATAQKQNVLGSGRSRPPQDQDTFAAASAPQAGRNLEDYILAGHHAAAWPPARPIMARSIGPTGIRRMLPYERRRHRAPQGPAQTTSPTS